MKIKRLAKVSSTNEVARDEKPGTIIVAREQARGKGRFGRVWESGKGGLWMSLVVVPSRPVQEYTMLAALAVRGALGSGFSVKWPNDVLYKGKKVCGILSEAVFSGNKPEKVIVGIGVNVNNVISSSLNAVSLRQIRKKEVPVDVAMQHILGAFTALLELSSEQLLERYKEQCSTLGKDIRAATLSGDVVGKAVDITPEGELVVQTTRGKKVLQEGDVSIL
ncbi:MAG: biotin--[acetyl-CoA-carboxylase] ligase [Nanoarchaeota archaeon]|nr:biotin--[acetyl-CoA-carboxylase] ligase [Nanoarchaeota archaeon]